MALLRAALAWALWGTLAACSGDSPSLSEPSVGEAASRLSSVGTLVSGGAVTERRFGTDVDLDGDTAIVSAPLAESVYVFQRENGAWKKTAALPGTSVGRSKLALDADTLAVPSAAKGNTALVYVRSASTWTLQQEVTLSENVTIHSVALRGDTVAFGSIGTGVFVFTRSAGAWTQQQKVLSPSGATPSRFGESIALGNELLVIGDIFATTGAADQQGAAWVFARSGSAWTQVQRLDPASPQFNGYFGREIALDADGTQLVVGHGNAGHRTLRHRALLLDRVQRSG